MIHKRLKSNAGQSKYLIKSYVLPDDVQSEKDFKDPIACQLNYDLDEVEENSD